MAHFLGTHQNKLDAKGRVSVPAQFRTVIKAQSNDLAESTGVRLVLRPHHHHSCIEAWSETGFQTMADEYDRVSYLSPAEEDFAATLFADAFPVESDREGRIVLPDRLRSYAGLTEAVVFVGIGRKFQIWEPAAAQQRLADGRRRVKERELGAPADQVGAAS
jgi:MraZ protein